MSIVVDLASAESRVVSRVALGNKEDLPPNLHQVTEIRVPSCPSEVRVGLCARSGGLYLEFKNLVSPRTAGEVKQHYLRCIQAMQQQTGL